MRPLLETGCPEETKGDALLRAARKGHEGSVSLLLEAGCSEEDIGHALVWAVHFGHEGCVKLLTPKSVY